MIKSCIKLTIVCFFIISAQLHAETNSQPPGYAVASAHPLATEAGLSILAAGGNAFDAAIAIGAALAVVEPYHSGLGGGGFWLIHDEKKGEDWFIDGREQAPHAAHKDMFLDKNNRLNPDLSLNGGLAAAIPGQPAALIYLSEHYGRLPLSKTLAPAIRLAEKGFPVDAQFIYFAAMDDRLQVLKRYPASIAAFFKQGEPYKLGEILRQPDLGHSLRLMADKGRQGFYNGEVATALVKAVNEAGGVWTLQDLNDYQVKIRAPLVSYFHNMKITTAPPPSAGGIILVNALAILEEVNLPALSRLQWVHYLIEAMRLSYWQANHNLADPDYVAIPMKQLRSTKTIQSIRQKILENKALDSYQLSGSISKESSPNTTHIAVIDREGNRVSATMTINYIFGSGVVAAGTGIVLNDEMDDFAAQVGQKNVFGVVGNAVNIIEPGKRPLSFMTPTFLEMPDRVAILGTPGGSRIASMVLLSALQFYNFQGAISMVSAMRFHHQYLPDIVQFEPETFSPTLQTELQQMGYHLMALKQYYGDMQAITWDKKQSILTATSDPRHIGLAVSALATQKDSYGFKH